MSVLWWVGQGGIVTEIIGASAVVYWARKASAVASSVQKTPTGTVSMGGLLEFNEWQLADTREMAQRQAKAFVLISLGLLMQLVGNLGSLP